LGNLIVLRSLSIKRLVQDATNLYPKKDKIAAKACERLIGGKYRDKKQKKQIFPTLFLLLCDFCSTFVL